MPGFVRVAAIQTRLRTISYKVADVGEALERVRGNIDDLTALAERAAKMGCHIIAFPEDTLGTLEWEAGHWDESSELLASAEKQMLNRFGEVAARHGVYIICCNDCVEEGLIYNTAILLGNDGQEVGRYHKVNLPIHEQARTPGTHFPVFEVPGIGAIGMCICYDMVFPETTRALALAGADIVFHLTMGGASMAGSDASLAAFRARAADNFVYVVVAFRGGGSMIISPKGEILADGGRTPDAIVTADIDPTSGRDAGDALGGITTDFRARLFRERVPSAYSILMDEHPPILDKLRDVFVPSPEKAAEICAEGLTTGADAFYEAERWLSEGKIEEARKRFEELSEHFGTIWIGRVSRDRLAADSRRNHISGSPDRPRKPVRINVAEAIIEPFWDPGLSGFREWKIFPGTGCGLQIRQNWAAVDFEWASKPQEGPALRMTRDFSVDCAGYDHLVFSLTLPRKSTFRAIAHTDKGERTMVSSTAGGGKVEYTLHLQGAARIDSITLEIAPEEDGNAGGWLQWIGLQNADMLKRYFSRWDYSDMRWDAYIRDDSYASEFQPFYGIFMTAEELEDLRAQHRKALAEHGESEYTRLAESARSFHPERGIHEFANSGGSIDGHGRVRDGNQAGLNGNAKLATAGLVLRDAETLRMAARYALSLAMSERWETGFMSSFPGCAWEDRAFRRSYSAQDIAFILDLAGEILTETGRTYLMRRLAEEGVGPINYVMWRHEYVFHCNQFAYFNTGRMCAYLVLERMWHRVKPYTDLAYREAIDNLETVIQPDGGCLEGPSYFGPTIRENYNALKYYARSRGKEISRIIPDVLRSTADFAAAVASTTEDDVIAVCDAEPGFRGDTLRVLTELMPGSYWTTIYNKQRRLKGERPLSQQEPSLPAFIFLPHTGYMASTRKLGGHTVRLFIMGNKAGADHTHEDKGSFVLEFAGQTFAMDLGICDYDDPIHAVYKHCQRHNMLAPVGMPERAHPLRPLPVDVKPAGSGDDISFYARIDATPGWEGYYRKWVRTWDSLSPDRLVIRDEYELARGDGVEFYWQTSLPVEHNGHSILITGARGAATLTVPDDCIIRVDNLPLFGGGNHNRIAIRKEGLQDVLEMAVKLNEH